MEEKVRVRREVLGKARGFLRIFTARAVVLPQKVENRREKEMEPPNPVLFKCRFSQIQPKWLNRVHS
jgi:hypothetical protein